MRIALGNVQSVCALVDFNTDNPLVDLSDVAVVEPYDLVYLGMFLRFYNAKGISFSVKVPDNDRVREYLATQNFWGRFNFSPDVIREESVRRHITSTSLNDVIDIASTNSDIADEIVDYASDLIEHNGLNVDAGEVHDCISELVDNFAQHSESFLGAFAMQYYPPKRFGGIRPTSRGRVEIAIGDCGIGIRTSLARNELHARVLNEPHHVAIRRALEPLVSTRAEGGTGLTEVRAIARRIRGVLRLTSGDGYYIMSRSGIEMYGTTASNLSGVQIQLTIPERSRQ